MPNVPLITFNSGEVSSKIDARSDVEKYRSSCRTLLNMIPLIYGIAERRPGTEFIYEAKLSPQGVRLIPFIYSATIAYMCEFGNQYARFYYDGAILLDGADVPVEVETPYLVADLPELQIDQIADTQWQVHGNYAPRKLTRTSATEFAHNAITFTRGPFRLRNDLDAADDITLTSTATTVDATGTLTASGDVFDDGHVGALFQLTHPRTTTIVTLAAAGTSTALDVKGKYHWITRGTWVGTATLQRNENSAGWETVMTKVSSSGAEANIDWRRTELEYDVQYRIVIAAGVTGNIGSELTVENSMQKGIVRIDSVSGPTSAGITVLHALASTDSTIRWAEGSWSTYRGFPGAFCFHGNRAVYASTTKQPSTIWFSRTDSYENFDAGTNDAESFEITLLTTNQIRWLVSLKALVVGTSGDEWRVQSNKLGTPITPTSFNAERQTEYGSAPLQALRVNETVLFADFVRRKVREFTSTGQQFEGDYVAPDLTALAEHITKTGITSWAHQRNPDSIVWATRADGTLLTDTHEREQNVTGWARHLVAPNQVDATARDWDIGYLKHYPVLRPLTDAEIPPIPPTPADTALSSESSITNSTELLAMNGSNDYQLANDIDLTGVTWVPIVGFSGTLDGNGKTISNLSYSSTTADDVGLFSTMTTGAEVRDLTFEDCTLRGDQSVGLLCGSITQQANITIKNVTLVDCSVTGGTYVGGLVGFIQSTGNIQMFGCSGTGMTIVGAILSDSDTEAGGLVGGWYAHSTISAADKMVSCYVAGTSTISGESYIGGLAGLLSGRTSGGYFMDIHSCYVGSGVAIANNAGEDIDNAGGLIGWLSSANLTTCYAKAAINTTDVSTNNLGGLLGGCDNTTAINCYSTGDITYTDTVASTIYQAGGFIGKFDVGGTRGSYFLRCYSTGSIAINNTAGQAGVQYSIGGFAGIFGGTTTEAKPHGVVSRCWCEGDISFTELYNTLAFSNGGIGGFVGGTSYWQPEVKNCYSWSSITATGYRTDTGEHGYVGGFMGAFEDTQAINEDLTILNSYAAQTNSKFGSGLSNQLVDNGLSEVGGLLGADLDATYDVVCTECFWDTETADISADDTDGGAGHTTDWMMTKQNFVDAGWDMDLIWKMADGGETLSDSAIGTTDTVAVIPGVTEDEVWTAALLDINGTPRRYILRFKPRRFNTITDAFFCDAGLTIVNNPASTTISGLDHLIGEEVICLGDGVEYTPTAAVNSDGKITVSTAVATGQVGLPNRYTLSPMRPDIPIQGTTHGSITKIAEMGISFLNTMDAQYGVDVDNLFDINPGWTSTKWDNKSAITGLFTGIVTVSVDGGFSIESNLIISDNKSMPCTVRALIPRMDKTGR